MNMRRLFADAPDFDSSLSGLLSWDAVHDASVSQTVAKIIESIRQQGDAALFSYTQEFDKWAVTAVNVLVPSEDLKAAWKNLPQEQSDALTVAAQRLRDYAQQQKLASWEFVDASGNTLGQRVNPLQRVGVYVPGGKAAYPSSVLMNVIPAKVAGVPEITMVTPTPLGEVNQLVLAAAYLAGVDQVVRVGGAQAIAALAYGTELISAVDKIVGPGNAFVAEAKKQVFGKVGIDMIAGPSEILIICDGKTNPDWIAMDLFSQAEHDEQAQAILISPDESFLEQVEESIVKLLPNMERAEIIQKSFQARGAFIQVNDLDQAVAIANKIAPEHLELSVENPAELVEKIQHAGAIFMGRYTPEALGDYCAGPNHVLPTAGTSRFSSPLGVYDFQKRSSLIFCSQQGASDLAESASVLARGEGLTAHAMSAEMRSLRKPKN
ncbi:MAG: histidinol dehydrogenase [Cycloclasticus sp. symbiont of Poecilosclerida sp. M]|nr:MAG: histidinol dehydrogenase [Cycloclasticus sp. symbiont of Poecilosclerida sp. M]